MRTIFLFSFLLIKEHGFCSISCSAETVYKHPQKKTSDFPANLLRVLCELDLPHHGGGEGEIQEIQEEYCDAGVAHQSTHSEEDDDDG